MAGVLACWRAGVIRDPESSAPRPRCPGLVLVAALGAGNWLIGAAPPPLPPLPPGTSKPATRLDVVPQVVRPSGVSGFRSGVGICPAASCFFQKPGE